MISIRPFTPRDAAPVAALLRASFDAAYRGLAADEALDEQLARIDAPAVLASVSERAARGAVVLVADDASGVAAYAVAGPSRDDDRDPAHAGEVYALYVHPRAWRTGVGRALQRECLEHLRLGGATTADLWVLAANENATGFYVRTGWTRDVATRILDFLGGAPAVRYTRTVPVVRRFDPATEARALAEAHVGAWRDAYRGLMPDAHLDGLDVERFEAFWRADTGQTWVCLVDGLVCGFVNVGPSRDADQAAAGHEVYAINVRRHAWGTGAGLALLRTGEAVLRAAGARDATLWVLDGNARARRFYEREGWASDGATKDDVRDGWTLHEVRYRKSLAPK